MLKEGYTLMHEHVTIDLSGVKNDQDCHLDCYEETVKEFKQLYEYGVRNIVEVTNIGMGRDIAYNPQAVIKNHLFLKICLRFLQKNLRM